MRRIIACCCMLSLVFLCVTGAYADIVHPDYTEASPPSSTDRAAVKLTRGLVNIFTGWLEVPIRIAESSGQDGIHVGLTYGFVRGVGMGLVRTGAGLWDTVTFPGVLIMPDEYPIIVPETLWGPYPEED